MESPHLPVLVAIDFCLSVCPSLPYKFHLGYCCGDSKATIKLTNNSDACMHRERKSHLDAGQMLC
jgi:hypothetical protein